MNPVHILACPGGTTERPLRSRRFCLPKPGLAGRPSIFPRSDPTLDAPLSGRLLLFDLIELHEFAQGFQVHALYRSSIFGWNSRSVRFLILEVSRHFGQFEEPFLDGALMASANRPRFQSGLDESKAMMSRAGGELNSRRMARAPP